MFTQLHSRSDSPKPSDRYSNSPHPGAVEKSIGAKETKELAVMVDTFHPLQLTVDALDIENEGYVMSWAE